MEFHLRLGGLRGHLGGGQAQAWLCPWVYDSRYSGKDRQYDRGVNER